MAEIEGPIFLAKFDRYPTEAAYIGRIVAGYGELEFGIARCLSAALGDSNTAFKTMYRIRGEEQRILIADALMRSAFEKADLKAPYCEAIADTGWCRTIRNQYAHCHWIDYEDRRGLYFVELENGAKKADIGTLQIKPISPETLGAQDFYFAYVQQCLTLLEHRLLTLVGKPPTWTACLPKKLDRPPLHSASAQ